MSEVIRLWNNSETRDFIPTMEYFPEPGARGAVVVFPGGGYVWKAEHEGNPIARMLNSSGISAFVVDYQISPCEYMEPLREANRAVRIARSYGYQKVAVLGFSAGGNLCCNAAVHYDTGNPGAEDPIERYSSRPDAFIPCYPVATFTSPFTHTGSRDALLGDKNHDESLISFFSAEQQVTDDTPPAFIWHTSMDELVPVQNSLMLAKALADHHIPYELHIYTHGRHGLGLASEMIPAGSWGTSACLWLMQQGFGK